MGQIRKLLISIGTIAAITMLGYYVLNSRNFETYQSLQEEVEVLRDQNAALMEHSEKLKERINAIKTNPRFIEKQARDTLGLVHGDEILFVFGPRYGKDHVLPEVESQGPPTSEP